MDGMYNFSLSFVLLCVIHLHAREIVRMKSFDSEVIDGRLIIPPKDFRNKIVIDVPSSGPHTYEDTRKIGRSTVFKYHDYSLELLAGIFRKSMPEGLKTLFDQLEKF